MSWLAALATGCSFEGDWDIECFTCKRRERVSGNTSQHTGACGHQFRHGNGFFVVCPRFKHCGGRPEGITKQHLCDTCQTPCRLDLTPPPPPPHQKKVMAFYCSQGHDVGRCSGGLPGEKHVMVQDPLGNWPCPVCKTEHFLIEHTHAFQPMTLTTALVNPHKAPNVPAPPPPGELKCQNRLVKPANLMITNSK